MARPHTNKKNSNHLAWVLATSGTTYIRKKTGMHFPALLLFLRFHIQGM